MLIVAGQHQLVVIHVHENVDLVLQLALGKMLFRVQIHVKMPFFRRLCAGQDQQMIRLADLCRQWHHKFVVFGYLIKLFHAVKSAAFEALDAGIDLCDILHLVDDLVIETRVGLQDRNVLPTFQYIWISSALTVFKACGRK